MTQTERVNGFDLLRKHQYANLITFRKRGEAVKTPVWFALAGGRAYVMTVEDTGKVKRIRANSRVELGPSDGRGTPLGPTLEGQARILGPEEVEVAKQALDGKYGLMKLAFDFFLNLRGTRRAWIEITPV